MNLLVPFTRNVTNYVQVFQNNNWFYPTKIVKYYFEMKRLYSKYQMSHISAKPTGNIQLSNTVVNHENKNDPPESYYK